MSRDKGFRQIWLQICSQLIFTSLSRFIFFSFLFFLPVWKDFSMLMLCDMLKLICQKSGQNDLDISQTSITSISKMLVSNVTLHSQPIETSTNGSGLAYHWQQQHKALICYRLPSKAHLQRAGHY